MNEQLRELVKKWRAVAEKQRGMASRDNKRWDLECAARMAGMAERTEYMADELEAALALLPQQPEAVEREPAHQYMDQVVAEGMKGFPRHEKAKQPEAGGAVTDEVVEVALVAMYGKHWERSFSEVSALCRRDLMRAAITAALSITPIAADARDGEDAARLNWLDARYEAYGFENEHEGNRWMIEGPYRNLRAAIDAARSQSDRSGVA